VNYFALQVSRFGLRGPVRNRIAQHMSICRICGLAALLMVTSCREDAEVVVTETRGPTTKDVKPRLFASSHERFRNTKPSPVQGDLPDGWREVPGTEMRLLNYRFGESGLGEVWVTISSGTVLDNVNRWLQQFDAPPLDPAGLAELRTVPVLGASGVWVEAAGDYASGMGAENRPGFGLAGVVAPLGSQIFTVKMVGPAAEVAAAQAALEGYVTSLRMAAE